MIWSFLWIALVSSDPQNHPLISEQELSLIVNSQQSENSIDSVQPSWRHIFTSSVFYSILFAKITYGIVFDFVITKIPAYLEGVIHLEVNETGLALAFIMTGYGFTLFTCGVGADYMLDHTSLGKCRVRKLFQLASGSIMAITLFCMTFVGSNKWPNVLLLAGCMFGYGFTSGGDVPIVADNSGSLSGTVFAIMNTLCSISGFAIPYIVGVVIESTPNSLQLWNSVINFCVFLVVIGTVFFMTSASSKFQSDWIKDQMSYSSLEKNESLLDLVSDDDEDYDEKSHLKKTFHFYL